MIFSKEINGVKFTFVCELWKTRNSWGHKVKLYQNDTLLIGTAKVLYYKGTWERYKFKSVIKIVIFDAIERRKAAAKIAFKALQEYKVMTKKRAAEFIEYLIKDPEFAIYNELYRMF